MPPAALTVRAGTTDPGSARAGRRDLLHGAAASLLSAAAPTARAQPQSPAGAPSGPVGGTAPDASSGAQPDPLFAALPAIAGQAARQYRLLLSNVVSPTDLPRTFADGQVRLVGPKDWTSGFFPGCLWRLLELTGDAYWRDRAREFTQRLQSIQHYRGIHDVGFMLGCSYGNGLRLTGDAAYREVIVQGARSLATRFNPRVGMIRSWDFGTWKFPVIIDSLMNLELLLVAAREGGEPRLREIATSHADYTLRHHFREDHSSYHVVDFDPSSGAVRSRQTAQGAADSSAWARGQAWALYGYTMLYRETRHAEYLRQASNVARFILNHPRLPADRIPYWDFDAPDIPDTPRDASAAAIMASALIELRGFVDAGFAAQCLQLARQQLQTLSSPAYFSRPGENGGFLLMHSVGSRPSRTEVDVPLNWADYYFLEALLRYRQLGAR